VPKLEHGKVIAAKAHDPQGRNEKRRPLIVLSAQTAIDSGDTLLCVAITTRIPNPPVGHVLLPWHRSGQSITGLKEKSAAVCIPPWIVPVRQSDLDLSCDILGIVPPAKLLEIKRMIDSVPI
jgi:PemK-like, MazF-like toxin of type II toxin-antitoxin system